MAPTPTRTRKAQQAFLVWILTRDFAPSSHRTHALETGCLQGAQPRCSHHAESQNPAPRTQRLPGPVIQGLVLHLHCAAQEDPNMGEVDDTLWGRAKKSPKPTVTKRSAKGQLLTFLHVLPSRKRTALRHSRGTVRCVSNDTRRDDALTFEIRDAFRTYDKPNG